MPRNTCMKVAVAVIFNPNHHVLITHRSPHGAHGSKWEFPGGKLKENELPIVALKREVYEEVGLRIQEAKFLCDIHHVYDKQEVILLVYGIHLFQGIASCRESQTELRWVALKDLSHYDFPAANKKIIQVLIEEYEVSV